MRIWLGLCCALALVGCTRDNPAYDTGDTQAPPETGSETLTSSTIGESSEAGSSESSETIAPECHVTEGPGGYIEVVLPCNPGDQGVYDRWFKIVEVDGSAWGVESCNTPSCGDCETQVISDLVIEPLDLAPLAALGTCVHVKARRLATANVDSCEYHTIVVEADTPGGPNPIVLARTAAGLELPPVSVGAELADFNPIPVVVEACSCDDDPEACCNGDVTTAPTTYAWNVGLAQPVNIDTVAGVVLDGRDYDFWALDASNPGGCDAGPDFAWVLY